MGDLTMRGTDIIFSAKKSLKDFITFEGTYLYKLTNQYYPNWENGEDWVINLTDILAEGEKFNVTLSVCDNDTTYEEKHEITSIHITLDDNLFFWDEDNEEHHYEELKTDDLATIANLLETKVIVKTR